MPKKKQDLIIEEIERFAIFFNGEFIGEADSIKIERKKGDTLPMIEIKGKSYLSD